MAKTIPLTQGYETIVDDEDYDLIQKLTAERKAPKSWHVAICKVDRRGRPRKKLQKYAAGFLYKEGNKIPIRLHNLLMNPPTGFQVDHIDRNGLNNQRANLRIVTPSQNQQNQSRRDGKFKGVTITKDNTKNLWMARIKVEGRQIYLGRFSSDIKAARAYNEAAIKYHGEFALLNQIPQEQTE